MRLPNMPLRAHMRTGLCVCLSHTGACSVKSIIIEQSYNSMAKRNNIRGNHTEAEVRCKLLHYLRNGR